MATGSTTGPDGPQPGGRGARSSGSGSTGLAAGAGALAYLVGFAITYFLLESDIRQNMQEQTQAMATLQQYGADPPAVWQGVGWFFYGAHNVQLEISAEAAGQSFSQSVPVTQGPVWTPVLYLIPVLALVGAGALATRGSNAPSHGEAAKQGATVIAGYLPLAIAGVFVVAWSAEVTSGVQSAEVTLRPQLMTAVLLAGIVYPAVFGGIGGYVAHALGGGDGTPSRGRDRHPGAPDSEWETGRRPPERPGYPGDPDDQPPGARDQPPDQPPGPRDQPPDETGLRDRPPGEERPDDRRDRRGGWDDDDDGWQ